MGAASLPAFVVEHRHACRRRLRALRAQDRLTRGDLSGLSASERSSVDMWRRKRMGYRDAVLTVLQARAAELLR